MKSRANSAGATGGSAQRKQQLQALAEAQLRDASVRVTGARVKVLSTLLGARCAFSHQDMQEIFADMDRVTLYRALDCLIEADLAHKIAGDDRVFRYSAGTEHGEHGEPTPAAHAHQHGHFKCTRCARVFCLDSGSEAELWNNEVCESGKHHPTLRQQLQDVLKKTLGKGFRSHEIELTIKGWCADCAH